MKILIVYESNFGTNTRAFYPVPSIKKWAVNLKDSMIKGKPVAIYDTRMTPESVDLWILRRMKKRRGGAAETLKEIMEDKGAKLIHEPQGFYVADQKGPLIETEWKRIGSWVEDVMDELEALHVRG